MINNIALGVDIGGTNTAYGIVSDDGEILLEGSISTRGDNTIEGFTKRLFIEVEYKMKSLNTPVELSGIGVGAPNGNYYSGNVEYAPNLPWTGEIPVSEVFKDQFNQDAVYVTNDANASAIGEMMYGNAKGLKDFMVITLGTGLGSGIVSNGKLLYGHNGFAGEVGHMIVEPNGRLCGCERQGCLETYASATAMVRTAMDHLKNKDKDSLLRKLETINSLEITRAAEKGDELALNVFEETARYLGIGLANAVAVTNPEAIIIQGGLAKAGDLLFKPTSYYLEENLLNIYKGKVKLLGSGLKNNNAAIVGAAALVWQESKKVMA
jgi:glucokinase